MGMKRNIAGSGKSPVDFQRGKGIANFDHGVHASEKIIGGMRFAFYLL